VSVPPVPGFATTSWRPLAGGVSPCSDLRGIEGECIVHAHHDLILFSSPVFLNQFGSPAITCSHELSSYLGSYLSSWFSPFRAELGQAVGLFSLRSSSCLVQIHRCLSSLQSHHGTAS
jgi:hypothetical protein